MSNTKNLLESVQNNLTEGSALRVFKPESEEYTRLQNFADELNNDERFQANYTVEDLYFDYGQNWMWTTIIAHRQNERGGGWQALTPKNQERVVLWNELDEVKQELLNNEEKLIGKRVTESEELTEAETSLIKTYNETDGGYKNNATSVYGELADGNYYDYIPDCEYLGIFNAPVEEVINHVYNTLDEDDTTFEEFAAEHEITNYENREALLAELNISYFGEEEE